MGLVYLGIGAIALAVGGGVLWGMLLFLEIVSKSFDKHTLEIIGLIPIGLIASYFIGYGIHENRKSHRKA